jgi:EVE domain
MTYWLDLFTPYTWTRFQDHGAGISGFRPRQRKTAFGRVKQGDIFLCYLVKLSRWCGVLEVSSDAFEDTTPIFADENDPFPIRFRVKPKIMLDFEHSIPIDTPELWNNLSFTKNLVSGSFGWAQTARLRQSLLQLQDDDGKLLCRSLQQQSVAKKRYELDAADRRNLTERTIVRTETGEVEVEVPEREELKPEPVQIDQEIRVSIKMQGNVAQLGAILGFNVWLPP